ncbi:MAG: hypothetical protein P8I38_07685 [Arenicella sp.]|jgi:hypothetical protein|nr:hypothetical protein [Arenicella sp.]
MNRYLVNNVKGRNHYKIYEALAEDAIFDLDETQFGWDEFSKISVGDMVFVINENKLIVLRYEVTRVEKNIVLDEHPKFDHIYSASEGGTVGVIFGEAVERIDTLYPKFVKEHNITSPKIRPTSGAMLPGFTCTSF